MDYKRRNVDHFKVIRVLMKLIGEIVGKIGDKPLCTLVIFPIALVRRYIVVENNERYCRFIYKKRGQGRVLLRISRRGSKSFR